MTIRKLLVLSGGILAAIYLPAHAQTLTAQRKAGLDNFCNNNAECEQLLLRQYAVYQNTHKQKAPAPASSSQNPPAAGTNVAANKPADGQSQSPTLPTLSSAVAVAGCPHDPAQALFIRSNSLDNFNYLQYIRPASGSSSSEANAQSSAIGASLSYTDNRLNSTQAATVNARISYLIFGKLCDAPTIMRRDVRTGQEVPGTDISPPYLYGFGIAPFVSNDGTWNHPFTSTSTTTKTTNNKKASGTTTTTSVTNSTSTTTVTTTSHGTITTTTKKTSTSAFRLGADFQLAYDTRNALLQENYFYASPFYQTDFAGLAEIEGLDVSWQPTSTALHLGVASVDPLYLFIWQFKGETELSQVSNPGYTIYTKGGHALVGETIRANLALFPLNSEYQYGKWFEEWVAGRISLIGTQQYYWDFGSKQAAPYYSAILQYKLGQCVTDAKTPVGSPCAIAGSSALSFEYDTGRDKDTLVKTNQFKVTLNFAY